MAFNLDNEWRLGSVYMRVRFTAKISLSEAMNYGTRIAWKDGISQPNAVHSQTHGICVCINSILRKFDFYVKIYVMGRKISFCQHMFTQWSEMLVPGCSRKFLQYAVRIGAITMQGWLMSGWVCVNIGFMR